MLKAYTDVKVNGLLWLDIDKATILGDDEGTNGTHNASIIAVFLSLDNYFASILGVFLHPNMVLANNSVIWKGI